ncbi:MAG: cation:proton antiporter regulatory subunit [Solirubrobacterales bacterium]
MSDVSETQLPGVGVRHDFLTAHGDRIGMISHRTGHRELLIYDREDLDACNLVLRLEEDDVRTLHEVLGGSHVTEELNRLKQEVDGLTIDWLPVEGASACANRSVKSIGLAADAGASIVAVVRQEQMIPSPPNDFEMVPGDTAVVVGTREGVEQMVTLLQGS